MTVSARKGKVIIRLGKCQCTIGPVTAAKLGIKLNDAAAKAAKQARAFSP